MLLTFIRKKKFDWDWKWILPNWFQKPLGCIQTPCQKNYAHLYNVELRSHIPKAFHSSTKKWHSPSQKELAVITMFIPSVSDAPWSPFLIGLVGLVSCILIFFLYYIIIRKCSLDVAILRSLTVIQFRNIYIETIQSSGADCTICLRQFQEDEWVRLLPDCAHIFGSSLFDLPALPAWCCEWFEWSTWIFCFYVCCDGDSEKGRCSRRETSRGYKVVETEVTHVWHIQERSGGLWSEPKLSLLANANDH